MTSKPDPTAKSIACEICLKEVPLNEAKRFEAEDYVAHFCGLDCYAEWKRRSEKSPPPKKTK